MATRAFLLIETEVMGVKEAVSALKQIKEVKSADPATGPYDIIATVEGETLNDIGDLVTSKINTIPHISRSVTCICLNQPVSYVSQTRG